MRAGGLGGFMIRSSRAAIVLSGTALALTAAMLPAQAATTGWRVSTELLTHGNVTVLLSVDAVSPGDAWVTGDNVNNNTGNVHLVLRHWTGKGWHPVTLPAAVARHWNTTYPFFTQIAASRGDVWVFNDLANGAYLHLTGTRWIMGSLPGGSVTPGNITEVTAAKDFGKHNAWAFGGKVNLSGPTPRAVPYAAHFNGHTWIGQTLPGRGAITAVSAASASSVWAVVGRPPSGIGPGLPGGATEPLVLHWTAKAGWQRAAVQPALPAGANLTSVVAEPGGTVWIGGSVKNGAKGTTAFAARWTPTAPAWALAHLGGASSGKWALVDMAIDGRGGIWGVALALNVKGQPERLWHLTGPTWSRVAPNFGKHEWILTQLTSVPGTASVWGVGAFKAGQSGYGLIAVDGPAPR
jgi:hypothetical protein